ncbi:hypothetical protein AB7W40_07505 [Providencia rettgeri]|nr:hypothetical protein [Providencia rettgeri]
MPKLRTETANEIANSQLAMKWECSVEAALWLALFNDGLLTIVKVVRSLLLHKTSG